MTPGDLEDRGELYRAVLAERFPPDTLKEQGVQPGRFVVADPPGVWYEQTRARKGLNVNNGSSAARQ